MVLAGEVITRFGADISQFSSGIKSMEQQAKSWDTMTTMHQQNFKNAMGRYPAAMMPVQNALRQTTQQVQTFGNQVQTTTSTSSGHFSRMASSTSGSFHSFGSSLLMAGAGIGGWVFAAKAGIEAAFGLGKALLGSSADMEQTSIAFKGLLGSGEAASQMMKTLQEFAAKTPFEFPELAEDTRMLLGMGVAAKDIIPWMTAIGDAGAGIGRGTEGVQRITIALGQMQARGKISGEEMMQLTEAGIPAWRLLAQSMGLSVAQVQDLSQKGQLGQDAINKLVAGMEKMYGGQMANQARTFNGLLSTLKDNAGMALRAFVGPLFEAAKNGLAKLTDLLGSPAFQSFAAGAAKVMADAFTRIGQVIGPVVSAIGQFIGSIIAGSGPTSQFGTILQQIGSVYLQNFVNLGQQIAAFVTGSLIPAIKAMQPTFAAIGNLFITTIIPAFLQIWPVINNVANVIRQVLFAALSAILPVIVNMANFITSLLVPAIKFIAPYVVEAAKVVGQFAADIGIRVIPIIQQLAAFINQAVNTIKAVWIAVWPTLGPILQGVWNVIVGIIQVAWSVISGIFKIALDLLSGNWGRAWNDMKTMLAGVWEGIKSIISGAWQIIQGLFNAARNVLVGIMQGIWNSITSMWASMFNTVSTWVNNIWNTVTSVFGRIRDTVGGIFRAAMNNIIGWLRSGITQLQNFINFFIDGINKVSQFFIHKDLVGRVSLGMPSYLASGTDYFKGGLAMVGERGRELVYLPRGTQVLDNKRTDDLIRRANAPMSNYAIGPVPGLQGGVGDVLGSIFSMLTGGVQAIIDKLLSSIFGGAPSLGIFGDIAGPLLKQVAGWLGDWIKKNVTAPVVGGAFTGNLPMASLGQFILPAITAYWKNAMNYGTHQGMDFAFPQGTPVHEVIGGRVLPSTGWYAWGGEADVQIPNGLWERYLHLSAIYAQAGQMLARGALVGLSGGGTPASGLGYWSSGSHLHIQYDTGSYQSSVNPLSVWASYGIFKPFGKGGIINEKIMGMGMRSGAPYVLGEGGSESITPAYQQARMIELLERIERVLTGNGPVTEYQVTQALGKLLTNGVR